jgi:hypothetical protein
MARGQNLAWRGVDIWMRAEDLQRVGGEDYQGVPTRIVDDSFF